MLVQVQVLSPAMRVVVSSPFRKWFMPTAGARVLRGKQAATSPSHFGRCLAERAFQGCAFFAGFSGIFQRITMSSLPPAASVFPSGANAMVLASPS